MGVSVNKPRQHHTSAGINHLSTSIDEHADLSLCPDSLDQTITHKHYATRNDCELAELNTNTRARRSGKRHNLRAINNSESLTCVF
jgi:hypothetical protein